MPNWLERMTENARNEIAARKNAETAKREQERIARQKDLKQSKVIEEQGKAMRKENNIFLASVESAYRPIMLLSDIKNGPWRGVGKIEVLREEHTSRRSYILGHTYDDVWVEQNSYYGDTAHPVKKGIFVGVSFEGARGNFKMSVFSSCTDRIELWNADASRDALQHALADETSYRLLNNLLPDQLDPKARRLWRLFKH